MDTIQIEDLEVHFRVGVPEDERATPQKLLLCLTLEHPLEMAARSRRLEDTIDYGTLTQSLTEFGKDREWVLIETLAEEIADWVLQTYHPNAVTIEVKKFIIPNARYVGVRIRRPTLSST